MGLTGGGKGSLLKRSRALLFLQVLGSSTSFSSLQQDLEAFWADGGVGTDFPFALQSAKGL